mmetsp:Transcript_8824/g.13166  ORF Transcript_8824/g.13166 Transcript_8824/m.13166 type:complete len:181 (-) Transcript_8824:228-770(-)
MPEGDVFLSLRQDWNKFEESVPKVKNTSVKAWDNERSELLSEHAPSQYRSLDEVPGKDVVINEPVASIRSCPLVHERTVIDSLDLRSSEGSTRSTATSDTVRRCSSFRFTVEDPTSMSGTKTAEDALVPTKEKTILHLLRNHELDPRRNPRPLMREENSIVPIVCCCWAWSSKVIFAGWF